MNFQLNWIFCNIQRNKSTRANKHDSKAAFDFENSSSNGTELLTCLTFHHNMLNKGTGCGLGSGCGSVGRAVASDNRGTRFESRRRQFFIEHLLFTVNCIVLKRRK